MDRHVVRSLLIVCLLTATAEANPPQSNAVQWQPDLQTAHRVAQQTGRPMLLVFGASWCHYCHKLEQETLAEPRMAAYVNANFVPVRLDFDRDQRAVEILQLQSVPATVVLSPQVELLSRYDGYAAPTEYGQVLYESLQRHAERARIRQVSATASR